MRIIHADVLDGLRQLPADSMHCCVTSPPYWSLRDYGYAGQIGLEPTVEEHVAAMVAVFREVRRVLRPDGTLLMNYGDMWAGSWGAAGKQGTSGCMANRSIISARQIAASGRKGARAGAIDPADGLKPKDLVLMPERIVLALQADGWWVRDRIIWHKPNPIPSSVADRCTPAHETVWHLAKSARYYWDAAAIAEPRTSNEDSVEFPGSERTSDQEWRVRKRMQIGNKRMKVPGGWDMGAGAHGTIHRDGRTSARYVKAEDRYTRNRRNVWTIATEPYSEGHFATMPTELARLCILAGCPSGGTVLDPFAGAGTTGLVADRLQRNAVLVEMSKDYVENHIRPRLEDDRGGLLQAMEEEA